MSARWLIIFYLGVALAPLALARLSGFPLRPFSDEIATGAGMLAYSILLVEFVLSGRFHHVSGNVGMDVTMRAHQLLARSCLVLALAHPLLYVSPRGPALPGDPTRALTVTSDFTALSTGIVAFVLLPSLVLLSIRRSTIGYRYETWRLMHGLGALLIAAALLHHTLQAGRYAMYPPLAVFWWVLFGLACLTLAVVYLARPLRKIARPWQVAAIRKLADRTWHLELAPASHKGLDYRAGMFAWISVGAGPFSLKDNPFSIASAAARGPNLGFVIKELGDFTSTLGAVKPGARAYVDAPYGNLTLDGRDEPGIAMIAGGVGIAPMLGLLAQKVAEDDRRPCTLLYGNRNQGQAVDVSDLTGWTEGDGQELIHVLSETGPDWTGATGLITPDLMRATFDTDERRTWVYVLCGPPVMLEGCERALLDIGVPARNILSERFVYD